MVILTANDNNQPPSARHSPLLLLINESSIGRNNETVGHWGVCARTAIIDSRCYAEVLIRSFGDVPKGLYVHLIGQARWGGYWIVKAIINETYQVLEFPHTIFRQFGLQQAPGLYIVHSNLNSPMMSNPVVFSTVKCKISWIYIPTCCLLHLLTKPLRPKVPNQHSPRLSVPPPCAVRPKSPRSRILYHSFLLPSRSFASFVEEIGWRRKTKWT